MKSLFSAVTSPPGGERASSEERRTTEREAITPPATRNVFGSESFDDPPVAGDSVSPNAPTLQANLSPSALPLAVPAPRSIPFMRQVLEQSLGPDFLTYLAHLHSTNTQSDLINFGWNHSSGPLSQAEAAAIGKYAFVCPPTTVAPTATVPSASGHSAVPFRMKDIFADHTWLFTGSPEAGVCPALGASPVTVATFARELRQELLSSQVRDEVVLGHYLRRMLRGPVLQELNRKSPTSPPWR